MRTMKLPVIKEQSEWTSEMQQHFIDAIEEPAPKKRFAAFKKIKIKIVEVKGKVSYFWNENKEIIIGVSAVLVGTVIAVDQGKKYADKNGGFVYLMTNGRYTKVGESINPERRIREIDRLFSGSQLVHKKWFMNRQKAERAMHKANRNNQLYGFNGREWFDDSVVNLKPQLDNMSSFNVFK